MITDLAKLTTGLVTRAGVGPPLRMLVFAAMALAAWWFAPLVLAWVDPLPGGPALWTGPVFILIIVALVHAVAAAVEGECGVTIRTPWGLADFLRRAPFIAWCLITDDGKYVPIWAILIWPGVAVVDFILAVGTLVAVPCWGLCWGLAKLVQWLWAFGRIVWCVLSYTPLDKGEGRKR